MSFGNSISGLRAATKDLDVVSNNVANASTVGFKSSRAMFGDVYAQSGGPTTVGMGVSTLEVQQQFLQGTLSTTNNPLDLAIMGGGFFTLQDPQGRQVFSRNGAFTLDNQGYLQDSSGARLVGANGLIRVDNADQRLAPTATTSAALQLNLNAGVTNIDREAVPFDINNSASYHYAANFTTYDSLGNPHQITAYFSREGADPTNTWQMRYVVDGGLPDTDTEAAGIQPTVSEPVAVPFGANGTLPADFEAIDLEFEIEAVGPGVPATPLAIALDLRGSTQYAGASRVVSQTIDGNAVGDLDLPSVTVDAQGNVIGRYSNGQTRELDQVALATFANDRGLSPVGNTHWIATGESGQPVRTPPGTGSAGVLKNGTLEQSNVELTEQLVHMITAQRHFQANSQSLNAIDQMTQELLQR